MKFKTFKCLTLALVSLAILFTYGIAAAQNAPGDTLQIKLEGAKMPPVAFSHPSHVDKAKIACTTCHHKEMAGNAYEACVKCHSLKDVKGGAPNAKEAFHKQCINCHKDSVKKGVAAPTKCNECHKK
jgi:hypothetical protein